METNKKQVFAKGELYKTTKKVTVLVSGSDKNRDFVGTIVPNQTLVYLRKEPAINGVDAWNYFYWIEEKLFVYIGGDYFLVEV